MDIKVKFVEKFNSSCIFSHVNDHPYRIFTILGLEIRIRKPQWLWNLKKTLSKFSLFKGNSLETKIIAIEKEQILNSFLWDPVWYCKQYNYKFTKSQALDYWYKKGWKNHESPSKYLNLDYCQFKFKNTNPIIAYMSKNVAFFPDNKNNFKSPNDKKKIEEYLEYKKTRTSKSVIYTCITNDYDSLEEIETYQYINKDWDYICYTDNEEHINKKQIGIWEVKPLQFNELDNSRNNRWHKMHPHILFPQYEESIYLDSNINILTDKLFKDIEEKKQDFILPEHFTRLCIFDEYERVIKRHLDDINLIKKERHLLYMDNMPENFGLTENNILYRKHHKDNIINIMNAWWDMIIKYSKRDQLSLVYILWKNGYENLNDITIENARLDWKNYYVFDHKGNNL